MERRAEEVGARSVWSWALYDWANSAFATTVVAGFFPVFFKDFWSAGTEPTVSTFWLGVTLSLAGLTVALTAPMLGSFADGGGARKRSLALFAALAIAMTALLPAIPRGAWPAAATVYGLGYVFWLCSLVFYDSLLPSVSRPENVDRVSGLGFGLGYLGGGLLFAINVLMTLRPELFGLVAPGADEATRAAAQLRAVQLSFLTVAAWWALFAIPLLAFVPEPGGAGRVGLAEALRRGVAQLRDTFREIRRYRTVFGFLVAYWLYIDGVDTVITMAVDYGKALGFATPTLISALLLVQFVAFPCALAFGWAGQRFGPKRPILAAIGVYIVVTALATRLTVEPWPILGLQVSPFYALAILVGTAQGGVQALSRSLYTRLIPADRSAEFFGFYNMVGRFAAIIGPFLVGVVGRATGSPRLGIASIALLLVAGGALLARLDLRRI
jgi:UMF1 family MFS transporter